MQIRLLKHFQPDKKALNIDINIPKYIRYKLLSPMVGVARGGDCGGQHPPPVHTIIPYPTARCQQRLLRGFLDVLDGGYTLKNIFDLNNTI